MCDLWFSRTVFASQPHLLLDNRKLPVSRDSVRRHLSCSVRTWMSVGSVCPWLPHDSLNPSSERPLPGSLSLGPLPCPQGLGAGSRHVGDRFCPRHGPFLGDTESWGGLHTAQLETVEQARKWTTEALCQWPPAV